LPRSIIINKTIEKVTFNTFSMVDVA